MRMVTVGSCLLLAVACSHGKQTKAEAAQTAPEEAQKTPLQNAQTELGRAQDIAAKARANDADAQARLEVAKSERDINEAQSKRVAAQSDLLKKQSADKDALDQSGRDTASAKDAMRSQEARLAYLTANSSAASAERGFAEARVAVQEALVEEARPGAAQNPKLAEARKREEAAQKVATDRRAKAEELLGRWKKIDGVDTPPQQAAETPAAR